MSNDSTHAARSDGRLELIAAFGIALASITLALVAWRSTLVSSAQGDANRQGLIDALKQEASASEDWRQVYQEAAFAQNYDAYAAGLQTLAASSDPAAQAKAAQLKQFLLPAIAQLSPLANSATYRNTDGTYNLDQRFKDVEAQNPDLAKLSPSTSFAQAKSLTSQQRWLTVNIILLVIVLFWLTLAQIGGRRLRVAALTLGGVLYLVCLAGFGVIELVFFVMRLRG